MKEPTSLGALLKRYRVSAGLAQAALAERARLSTRAISDLERGLHRTPHPATIDLLASALALTPPQRAVLLAAARPDLQEPREPVAPSAAPMAATPAVPLPPTALIGREREHARALELLARPSAGGTGGAQAVRLLTVTGPGGAGKTRLALELAHDVAGAFADGVLFVALATFQEAALVPAAVAHTLGLRDQADATAEEQVRAQLRDTETLLVLDNCEHVLGAAPFVADLLAWCPRLTILATSRVPLRLRAEQTLPLAALSLGEAVALFRARAQAVRPESACAEAEVAEICEQVDCLPLAIELAAVQVRLLSLAQLRAHLSRRLALLRGGGPDLPARQRAMEDAIGWSYDLLTPAQQSCFRALGVFVGGWTLAAAQAVCWELGTIAPAEALLTLGALADASLVQAATAADGSMRLQLLELMREYALDRLRAAGEEEDCRRRHAIFFAQLAQVAGTLGPGATPLAHELPNARAALVWAEERQEAELGLRLTGFGRLWHIQGQVGEAVRWQERMLAVDQHARDHEAPAPPLARRVECLYGLGRMLLNYGQLEQADDRASEALALAQRIGDESGISNAYATRGLIAQAGGRLEDAAAAFAASYAHARQAGQAGITTHALVHLGELARLRGDQAAALTHLEEALDSARAAGNSWELAMISTMAGQLVHQRGDYAQARQRYHASLALLAPFKSPTYLAWCLESLAATLGAEGEHARATRLCAAAAALREQAHTPLPPAERAVFERTMTGARQALGESAFDAQWATGAAFTQQAALADALAGTSGTTEATETPARA